MPSVTTKQNISAVGRRQPPLLQHHYRHPVAYHPRVNGLGGVGFLPGDTSGVLSTSPDLASAGGSIAGTLTGAIPIVGTIIQGVESILQPLIHWFMQGQYKIDATQFAEGIVRVCYGLDPDCALPPGGIPIVPGANPPKFCANSVAGMIERCSLSNAAITLQQVELKMQQKLAMTNDPVTPYVRNWYNQYGIPTFNDLTSHIAQAINVCPRISGGGTTTGGGGITYPPISTTSTNWTPYLILGGVALFGLIMMRR